MHPWYVTGFLEKEGTFTYSRSGRQIVLYFAVKMADEKFLLSLQAFFGGIGKTYSLAGGKTYFRVTRQKDLERIVQHFEEYPLKTKAKCFGIWKEMVLLKRKFRKPDREQLDRLARDLSACS